MSWKRANRISTQEVCQKKLAFVDTRMAKDVMHFSRRQNLAVDLRILEGIHRPVTDKICRQQNKTAHNGFTILILCSGGRWEHRRPFWRAHSARAKWNDQKCYCYSWIYFGQTWGAREYQAIAGDRTIYMSVLGCCTDIAVLPCQHFSFPYFFSIASFRKGQGWTSPNREWGWHGALRWI